jgi:hypothetical protein
MNFFKKLWLAMTIVLLSTSAGLFANGLNAVGIYGNLIGSGTGSFGGGIGLTLKFGNFPVLGLEWMLAEQASRIGVSCDWWVINNHLGGALDYYLGIGGYLGIATGGQTSAIDIGARLPIGLQLWPLDKFEIFGEFAPMLTFIPTLNINFALRLGIRIHF